LLIEKPLLHATSVLNRLCDDETFEGHTQSVSKRIH